MSYTKLAILILPALYLVGAALCWGLAWLTPAAAKEITQALAVLSLAPLAGVLVGGAWVFMCRSIDKVFDE